MHCPYFKKVNFHRIEQRDDTEEESERHLTMDVNFEIREKRRKQEFDMMEESIPQEGFPNNVKVENYRKISYDSFNTSQSEENYEMERVITIKMPKCLAIKQLNINESQKSDFPHSKKMGKENRMGSDPFQRQLTEIKEEISEGFISESDHKEAKVFETRRNLFFYRFDNFVILKKTGEKCQCHLDSSSLKILSNSQEKLLSPEIISKKCKAAKTRFFVDLSKYSMKVETVTSTVVEISVIAKGITDAITIEFLTPEEMYSFQCVYSSLYEDRISTNPLRMSRQKEQGNEKETEDENRELCSERSIDSLGFTVQRMKYNEAEKMLETFDIVLFKGRHLMCKFQRFITNSDYDHVGMVIKTIDGSLLLLQATGNAGVAIYSFSSIHISLQKKIYERIAIRKFCSLKHNSYSQTQRRLILLQEFVKHANGKKYKFTPMYLLSNSLTEENEEETYFCSELIAEALMTCGIMNKNKPSYRYLPKHFGDEQGLNGELCNGYQYSEPIILSL